MACYRLSFLTIDGQWRGGRDFACASDDEACEMAQAPSQGWGMQLWRRDTLVRSFPVVRQETAALDPQAVAATPPALARNLRDDRLERLAV